MYGYNPFAAQDVANANASAIVSPPLQTRSTFRFTFSSQNIDMLNCSVVGPGGDTRYRFVTNPGQGHTVLKNAQGGNIAIVEWRSHPTVEAHDVCAKQPIKEWLKLTPEKSSRTMKHDGVSYFWTPVNLFLHLFAPGSSEWLARVTRTHDSVVLELSPCAVKLGLTNAAILGAALLQCGKSVD